MLPIRLHDLPTELLIRILESLNTEDIANIRATCRSLAAVTRERIVWATALRKISHAHGIVEAAFTPLHEPLSSSQLEFLARRPRSLIKRVQKTKASNLVPPVHYPLDLNPLAFTDVPDDPQLNGFIDVMLIPGGRYMLTNYKFRVINLWDLGIASDDFQRRPVVSLKHPIDPSKWLLCLEEVSVSSDHQCIRFIIHTEPVEDDPSLMGDLEAYEIVFGEKPRYQLLATLSAVDYNDIRAFNGDYFLFRHQEDSKVSIWDVNNDSAITWVLDDDSKEFSEASISDTHCILFSFGSFEILSASIPMDELQNTPGQRIFRGNFPMNYQTLPPNSNTPGPLLNDIENGPCVFYRTFRWQGPSKPLHFIQFFEDFSEAPDPNREIGQMNVYSVSAGAGPSKPGSQDEEKSSQLHFRHLIPLNAGPSLVGGLWGYFCEDSYVLMWVEHPDQNGKAKLMLSASEEIEVDADCPVGEKHVVFYSDNTDNAQDDEALSDFCPISARLIHMDHGKLHLYEYLPLIKDR